MTTDSTTINRTPKTVGDSPVIVKAVHRRDFQYDCHRERTESSCRSGVQHPRDIDTCRRQARIRASKVGRPAVNVLIAPYDGADCDRCTEACTIAESNYRVRCILPRTRVLAAT
jgi:hypothetical protein